jgi:hypothetical protein
MGRYDFSDRRLVEDCLRLSVFRLIRELKKRIRGHDPAASKAEVSRTLAEILAAGSLRLTSSDGSNQEIDTVPTRANLGFGLRYWFLCPRCSRRVAILFKPSSRADFWCRECHNLTYRCQKEHDRRVDEILKSGQDPRTMPPAGFGASSLLVLLKAWKKADEAGFERDFCGYPGPEKSQEVDFCIDLSSFGEK